jgi:phosphoglycerate dehydrogenase-like enzyme
VDKNSLATDRLAFVDLETALGEADVLLINCPMTPSTRGMIGAAELDRMKRGSFLVNTARGGIVDEQALADALISGQLAGAGIDVFETEPVPLDNPLLKTPNTIVAPHSLAWTDQLFKANGEESIANILAYVEGERSPGLVF